MEWFARLLHTTQAALLCPNTFTSDSKSSTIYCESCGQEPSALQPQGLSNGSEALLLNPPPVFAGPATGVCVVEADAHPPKSSSPVTVGACVGLFDDAIGDPQPPDISLGVMRDGTLPRSTVG